MAASDTSLEGRKHPQISANDLALYMVSSATAQLSIIRRHKYPSKHVVVRYQDVKRKLINFLASDSRDKTKIAEGIDYFDQIEKDPAMPVSKVEDARASKAVLESFLGSYNSLDLGKLTFLESPKGVGPLMLAGVRVTTNLDLLVRVPVKGTVHGGGAILRLSQVEDGDAAKDRRERMGDYVATLAYLQVDDKKFDGLATLPRACLSIDVQHQQKFEAKAGSRRITDLTSACKMIATVWPTV
jgi:hypothetical protein